MSMATLGRAVLAGARSVLNNPKLRKADILEWSTGDIDANAGDDEVVVNVPDPGVFVCVNRKHDKRAV